MSTWISNRVTVIAAMLALSGCVAGETGGTGGGTQAAPARMAVMGGEIIVAGPRGFCVDRPASRDGSGRAFVLLGSCASLTGAPFAPRPDSPAILTVTVARGGGDIAASYPAMDRFFRTGAGRGALSRSGKAASVKVLETVTVGDAFYLRLSDSAPTGNGGAPVQPDYWRAILPLKGQIVTLSVLGLAEQPTPAADKRRVLDAFVARMQAVNPAAAAAN